MSHAWMAGRRIQRADRPATVVRATGGPEAKTAEIVWQSAGEMQTVHWRPAKVVMAGRGNEVYALDEESLELKLYLEIGFGFQRFLTPPVRDRLIILGKLGVCVLSDALKELWRVEGLRSRDALEFDGFHERMFGLKARQRSADAWAILEFDLDTGSIGTSGKSRGPGAQSAGEEE
jgi:hypothetical protein